MGLRAIGSQHNEIWPFNSQNRFHCASVTVAITCEFTTMMLTMQNI